ncbi:hypothetical protein O9A_01310 [Bartonella koehlerae C-29]|uniref:DUF1153 domain-containing protein n=2 Tax=Bartonella koehlerae TaxID=92181 RepID=A0A067W771_9HYPH|nr:hypothetical protein O9A_01310 [Bartonella koehlerae C-29]
MFWIILLIFSLNVFSFFLNFMFYKRIKSLTTVDDIMTNLIKTQMKYVIGPDGSPLTIADLPPETTRRWVIRRKAEIVAAVRGGLLSLDEACQRYTLTVEEFLSWQSLIDEYGLAGLRITRIQHYRH